MNIFLDESPAESFTGLFGFKRPLAAGHWFLATCYWSLVTGLWLLVPGCSMLDKNGARLKVEGSGKWLIKLQDWVYSIKLKINRINHPNHPNQPINLINSINYLCPEP